MAPRDPSSLLDHQEILDLLYRYGANLDLHRIEEMREIFTDDCVFDVYADPARVIHGVDAVIDGLERSLAGMAGICHMYGNELVELEDPDHARCTANVHAWHRTVEGDEWEVWGRYDDELVRLPAGWRVQRRRERFFRTVGVTDGRFGMIDRLSPAPFGAAT